MPNPSGDHTITVTYTPGTPATWAFSPDPLTCTGAGSIWIEPASGSNWTVVGAQVEDPSNQFTTGTAAGKFRIHNAHTSNGTFKYQIQIQVQGATSIWSPDPQIINQNPTA
jgi:hypothetical protein